MNPAKEDSKRNGNDTLDHLQNANIDEDGNTDISGELIIGRSREIFGDKIFEDMDDYLAVADSLTIGEESDISRQVKGVVDTVKQAVKEQVITPLGDAYDLKTKTKDRIEKQVECEIEKEFNRIQEDYEQRVNIAKAELERARSEVETPEEADKIEAIFEDTIQEALNSFTDATKQEMKRTIEEKPNELVERLEQRKAETEKRSMEDDIRAHLRGFARTIPSFIMAYGDEKLTLTNFDDYTEDDVFEVDPFSCRKE